MRKVRWPSWLGCPICHGALEERVSVGELAEPLDLLALHCPKDSLTFTVRDGVAHLLPPGLDSDASAFTIKYHQQRTQQGWRWLTASELAGLPHKAPRAGGLLYWRVRCQSFRLLERLIQGAREMGHLPAHPRIVDMGCGQGWLARWLADWGCEVVAVDISLDDTFGLGALRRLRDIVDLDIALVRGSLESPPLQVTSVDAFVYNASLHYSSDLGASLAAATQVLSPGGMVVIMDTPVMYRQHPQYSAKWRGGQKLARDELEATLKQVGLTYEWRSPNRGWLWWLHQVRILAKSESRSDLPFIVATHHCTPRK